jgi:glycosyltransferase involved in cell wall biosynthesis
MYITYYQRRPIATGNFSIERVFADVRQALPEGIHSTVATSRYESHGLWRRVYNIVEAVFRQSDVNHITGDVHFLAYLLSKNKTLLTIHDCGRLETLSGWRKKVFLFFWFWLPEKRCRLISVISQATKKELLRHLQCHSEKIRIIPDPVSKNFQHCPKEFNSFVPTILQVGTGINKNISRVAEALQGIPCHLRIVGKLTSEQIAVLQKFQIVYSVAQNLCDSEMVAEYQKCDMVVFVSTYEGFGLPIVEAQATGRAVVTSNILSMPEVAGDAACIVDPFDVASIRDGILRLIYNKEYRESLIEKGFKNIDRFRPQKIAAQYAELYKELVESYHYKD